MPSRHVKGKYLCAKAEAVGMNFLLFIAEPVQDSCRLLPIDHGPTRGNSTDNWSRRRRRIELAIIVSYSVCVITTQLYSAVSHGRSQGV